MPSSTSLGLAELDVEVRIAGDRGKREAAAVEAAAVEIVGAREEAEDVKTSSTRVQQKSQASVEWAGKIASDAGLRQRSLARSAALKKGSRTYHEEHGSGTIVAVDDVAGVTVSFDDGETHKYNLASQRKLKPLLEEAHQLSSDNLFSLVDTDSSGTLDRPEYAAHHPWPAFPPQTLPPPRSGPSAASPLISASRAP